MTLSLPLTRYTRLMRMPRATLAEMLRQPTVVLQRLAYLDEVYPDLQPNRDRDPNPGPSLSPSPKPNPNLPLPLTLTLPLPLTVTRCTPARAVTIRVQPWCV